MGITRSKVILSVFVFSQWVTGHLCVPRRSRHADSDSSAAARSSRSVLQRRWEQQKEKGVPMWNQNDLKKRYEISTIKYQTSNINIIVVEHPLCTNSHRCILWLRRMNILDLATCWQGLHGTKSRPNVKSFDVGKHDAKPILRICFSSASTDLPGKHFPCSSATTNLPLGPFDSS